MKISALMPTRNRPDNLRRIFDSAIATVAVPKLFEFAIRIDDDDVLSRPVFEEYKDRLALNVVSGPGKQEHWGEYWNSAWHASTGEILGMIGDDFIYRTPGWDVAIRREFEAVPDRIIYVFGEDGLQHGYLGTHGFIHRRWTDAIGYYAPMQFNAYCHDQWHDDISKRLGRRMYRPNLYFEHMHPAAHKSEKDAGYKAMYRYAESDTKLWKTLESVRQSEADKLKGLLQ